MQIKPQIKSECKVSTKINLQLKLTPQMRQAIDILQFPLLELRSFLDNELIENPLLEEVQPEWEDQSKEYEELDSLIRQAEGDFVGENQIYNRQAQINYHETE